MPPVYHGTHLPGIDEQCLSSPVFEFIILLVLGEEPETCGYSGVEESTRLDEEIKKNLENIGYEF